jgi:sulfur carrier protein ThiS
MTITVKLVGGLIHTLGFSERVLDLPAGTTVAGLLEAIGIDPARPLIVGRSGWAIETDDEVHDGDRILISPVFSGG